MSPAGRRLRVLMLATSAIASLALGACKDNSEPEKAAAAGTALLPRSTTDEMPPYDTVRSQPPLADPSALSSSDGQAGPRAASPEGAATDSPQGEESSSGEAAEAPLLATPDAE